MKNQTTSVCNKNENNGHEQRTEYMFFSKGSGICLLNGEVKECPQSVKVQNSNRIQTEEERTHIDQKKKSTHTGQKGCGIRFF